MIGSGSTLQVSDNSGARVVQCIENSGKSFSIGDVITVAVKKAIRGKAAAGTVTPSPLSHRSLVSLSAHRLGARRRRRVCAADSNSEPAESYVAPESSEMNVSKKHGKSRLKLTLVCMRRCKRP